MHDNEEYAYDEAFTSIEPVPKEHFETDDIMSLDTILLGA